jgi:hypothetical protein
LQNLKINVSTKQYEKWPVFVCDSEREKKTARKMNLTIVSKGRCRFCEEHARCRFFRHFKPPPVRGGEGGFNKKSAKAEILKNKRQK